MKYRRLLWFGLWILSLVGISYYGGAASYGLFFALTLLPLISLLYLIASYLQFKIYQEVRSTDLFCGQPMPYSLILRNEGFLGISGVRVRLFSDFSQVTDISEATEYTLLPGDEFCLHARLICRYRGEYDVGVQQIIFTDFLKLFSFRYTLKEKLRVTVYPKVCELTQAPALAQLFTAARPKLSSIHKEPDVVVRDYHLGDSLRRIHWKNTARTGNLQVRNEIDENRQEITLLFDTGRYSKNMAEFLPLESRILEVMLSLSKYFLRQNTRLSVYYGANGIQKQEVWDMGSFETFYLQMSKLCFDREEHFPTLFQKCYDKGFFLNTKVLLAVFHEPDETILQLARQLTLSGVTVLLYAVSDHCLEPKITALPITADWEGLL